VTGRWFSPGPPVSSTNKTDHHDITEILLKAALDTIKPNQKRPQYMMLNIHKNVEGLNRVNGISTPLLDN
jgi:hypothetical protein